MTTTTLSDRIARRVAQRVARTATYHAKAVAYYRAHGDPVKAEASEKWLRKNLRCRECSRAITPDTAEKFDGMGGDCWAKLVDRRAS